MTKKILYAFEVPLRYIDQDSNLHINNVSHFRFFEEGRVKFAKEANVKADGSGQGPVVAHTDANFLQELFYPGTVLVTAYVKKIGNSSYTLEQTLSRVDAPSVIITRSDVTLVWLDHKKKQSMPIPKKLRDILEKSLSPD